MSVIHPAALADLDAEVESDVDRKAVARDPAGAAHPDRGDLAVVHPHPALVRLLERPAQLATDQLILTALSAASAEAAALRSIRSAPSAAASRGSPRLTSS